MSKRVGSSSVDAQNVKKGAQKIFKRVSDKVRVGMALFDEVATSLAKATNHDKVPPKEKHVKKIIIATHGSAQDLNFGLLVDTMGKIITDSKDWLVSIKGLQLFHRVIQDGSEEFIETVIRHNVSKLLNMSSWKDRSTAEAMEQSPFVRQYARYVVERVILYRNFQIKHLEIQMALPLSTVQMSQPEEIFKLITSLQRISDELLECYQLLATKESRLGNASTIGAFNLLVDDALALFKLLADANVRLLDLYFDMNKENARKGVELYENHCRQSKDLLELFKFAKKSGVIRRNIPALKATPDTILEAMREYLGESGTGTNKRKYEVEEEIPTMNLEEMLTPQELAFIKESIGESEQNPSELETIPQTRLRKPSRVQQPNSELFQFDPPATQQNRPTNTGNTTTVSNNSNISNNNNMINFDDFFGGGNNNPPSVSPPPQQYGYPPMQQQPPQPMYYGNNMYGSVPPPQQQQQYASMKGRSPSNAPPPQYYSNPQWGSAQNTMMNQNRPPMPMMNTNAPMNRQQEMIMRQQQFKQQYIQDKFVAPTQNMPPQQQQQQQQQDYNPFDDPFADLPMNPQHEKQLKNADVLHNFDF